MGEIIFSVFVGFVLILMGLILLSNLNYEQTQIEMDQ
jgi:hypothetical protein